MSELDKARDELTVAWREYRLFAGAPTHYPCPHVGDLPGAIEALVNAILDAREAKAPAPDDGGDVGKAVEYLTNARTYTNDGSGSFRYEGATIAWAIHTLRARISELERDRDDWKFCCEQNALSAENLSREKQKAEGSLAELRERVGAIAQSAIDYYETGGELMSVLSQHLEEIRALLTDPPPPAGDEPTRSAGSHDPAGTAVPRRGSDTVEGVDLVSAALAELKIVATPAIFPARDGDEPPVPGTDVREATRSAGIGGSNG